MTKLMFVLWQPDVEALHAGFLRADLAGVGATRLQVNVDDEPVAAALRIPAGDPVGAVVSVWTPGTPGPVVEALRPVAARLAGWVVEERRPLDPPETWDGGRADALANVAVLRRPAELEEAEWRRRWLEEHTPVAVETQATFGYLQNVVVEPVTDLPDGVRPVAAIVEELFPTAALTDPHAFYGSGGDDDVLTDRLTRLMASVARIGADRDLDLVPTSRYLYSLADGA